MPLRRKGAPSVGSGLRRRHDARAAPLLAEPLVEHGAVAEREEREVASHADVRPRVHVCAALADEDVPGAHVRAGEDLDPAPLAGAVAPVAGAALAFLVCHRYLDARAAPRATRSPSPARWGSTARAR